MRHRGDAAPYQDASPMGRAPCPQGAERSPDPYQMVSICNRGAGRKITRRPGDRTPYRIPQRPNTLSSLRDIRRRVAFFVR
jgi:hypothetical protein